MNLLEMLTSSALSVTFHLQALSFVVPLLIFFVKELFVETFKVGYNDNE